MQSLWMVAASFLFASMGVFVKLASFEYHAFEVVFYRGLIGCLFMLMVMRLRHGTLGTRVPGMHFWRGFVGVSALTLWFYAISQLPLATAMTLNYTSSMWIAAFLLGGSILLERAQAPDPRLITTVLIGFAGVALVLRPTIAQNQLWEGLLGLISGALSALAYLQVAALGKAGEPEYRVVFYFSLCGTLAGLIGMLFTGMHPLSWHGVMLLLPVGLFASAAQLLMTRAYTHGSTMVTANLQYLGIFFAALYSIWLFGDVLPPFSWLGMALIVLSGIAATILRKHAAPSTPEEEHA